MSRPLTPTPTRFWPKVDRREACWLWTGSTDRKGYGKIGRGGRGGWAFAHRVSWEMHNGPIPDGLSVCHRCDNPPCVRPDHLFLGTTADNLADAASKGRMPGGAARGELSGNAKITAMSVLWIRAYREAGHGLREIGRAFGVTRSNVCAIAKRRAWAHVAPQSKEVPA